MIYEFRLYTVTPGRLPDVTSRFRNVLPPLFARHGIDNVGRWLGYGGVGGPLWVYAMRYADLAERSRVWDSFYGDGDWWEARAATNAGEEMVEHFQLDLLKANALDPAATSLAAGHCHELLFINQPLGRTAESQTFLSAAYVPALERSGARLLLAADFLTGARLPRSALLLSWPSEDARSAAHHELAMTPGFADSLREQRQAYRTSLIGAIDSYSLRPEPFPD